MFHNTIFATLTVSIPIMFPSQDGKLSRTVQITSLGSCSHNFSTSCQSVCSFLLSFTLDVWFCSFFGNNISLQQIVDNKVSTFSSDLLLSSSECLNGITSHLLKVQICGPVLKFNPEYHLSCKTFKLYGFRFFNNNKFWSILKHQDI